MAEVVFQGLGARNGFGAETGPDVTYDGVGTPVFDGTIDVEQGGLGPVAFDNRSKDVFLGGRGTPVFDDTIEVVNEGFGPVGYDNEDVDVFVTGALGTPVFDGSIEVAQQGRVLNDTNGLNGAEVELGAHGTPVFPGVSQITPPATTANSDVFLVHTNGVLPDAVSYFGTPIIGPTYPVTNDR